jgi:hypothetical protein
MQKNQFMRYKIMAFVVCSMSITGIRGQISISGLDAQSWGGGTYLVYRGGIHDWENPTDLEIMIEKNTVWDFTQFSFDDTEEMDLRPLTEQEKANFPEGTQVRFNGFSQYESFYYGFGKNIAHESDSKQYYIELLTPECFVLCGILDSTYADFDGDGHWSVKVLNSINPDTIFTFPINYGNQDSSKLEFSKEYKTYSNYIYRNINAYGYLVVPGNDTLEALGLYEMMDVGSGKLVQSYIWLTKEYGVTARINLTVGPNAYNEMKIFDSGSTLDFQETNHEYGINIYNFILLLPESEIGIKQKRFRKCDMKPVRIRERFFFDLSGRKITGKNIERLSAMLGVDAGERTENRSHKFITIKKR